MKEFDLIIKNGTVVTSTESFLCDVAVKDGKIAAMAQNIEADAKEIYDAAGKLVLPGALDAHTHMAMPFGGTVSADSYMAGTRAAACGGVTTIFDYPVQHKGETIRGLVNSKKEVLEKEACIRESLVVSFPYSTNSILISITGTMLYFLHVVK